MLYDYQVPKNKRIAQVCCAIFWCLLSGGPIFGFAALKPVLIKQHIYESYCDLSNGEQEQLGSSTTAAVVTAAAEMFFAQSNDESNQAKCVAQDLKLNMMFTVGAVLTNVAALAIGFTLDRFGPKICGLIGAAFLYLSCAVFIFAESVTKYFDPYLVGYGCMALGGPFAFISSFQLSNAFPAKSGTVLALLTGAFDASSALFAVYKAFFNHFDQSIPIASFYKIYLLVPTFITLAQIFVMQKDSYQIAPENNRVEQSEAAIISENTALLSSSEQQQHMIAPDGRRDSIGEALKQSYADEVQQEENNHPAGSVFGILHAFDSSYQFKTYWFLLIAMFTTIQMLRLNYFVATINTQYTYLLDIARAEKLNKFFDIALPLGGIVSIPFVGLLLDNCATTTVLTALLSVSLIIGIAGVIPSMSIGFIHILIFVAYRPFFYTSISDFCAKVFGFKTFGKLYGTIMCISGIFNFLQSLLDKITHEDYNMNPIPVNVCLVILTAIIGSITIGYVSRQAKIYAEKKKLLNRVVAAVTGEQA